MENATPSNINPMFRFGILACTRCFGSSTRGHEDTTTRRHDNRRRQKFAEVDDRSLRASGRGVDGKGLGTSNSSVLWWT